MNKIPITIAAISQYTIPETILFERRQIRPQEERQGKRERRQIRLQEEQRGKRERRQIRP